MIPLVLLSLSRANRSSSVSWKLVWDNIDLGEAEWRYASAYG